MRFLRILLLHFEHITEHRARSFVWFLVSLFNPLIFILFWKGAFQGKNEIAASWTFSAMASYYFLLTIIAASLSSHIEEDVSQEDIKEGGLVQYLLKPYSYFWMKFYEAFHYRLLQGGYGFIALLMFLSIFGIKIILVKDVVLILLMIPIIVFAYLLSFVFKMIIGFISFWTIETRGLYSFVDVILLIFAGYIMPITLLIHPLEVIAKNLPFAYMIYFPVTALQGKYNWYELIQIIGTQIFWLAFLLLIYRFMWKKGIQEFSGVGQ